MRIFRQFVVIALAVVILCLPALMAAGCATVPTPDKAPPPVQIVTADRVITEACIKAADIAPVPAKVGSQLNGNLIHDVQILAALDADQAAWIVQAQAQLAACSL